MVDRRQLPVLVDVAVLAVDEPIAGLLPRGRFIVPFLAPDAFKEHMSAAYGAFVPESADELSAYLTTL